MARDIHSHELLRKLQHAPRRNGVSVSRRDHHGVDDVNEAVVRHQVGFDHLGVLDHDSLGGVDEKDAALRRGRFEPLAENFPRRHAAHHEMMGDQAAELFLVLGAEQRLDGAFGQFGEGVIGGREQGDGTLARQDRAVARRLDRRQQDGEGAGLGGGLDDIHGRRWGRETRMCQRQNGAQRHKAPAIHHFKRLSLSLADGR